MLEELGTQGPSTLQDYLQILWRRKWLIAQAVVLVPIVAVLWAQRTPIVYTASAGVLMQTSNLGANIAGVQDPTQLSPTRVIQTQIPVARLPVVAGRTIRALGLTNWSPSDLLGESTVTSSPDSSDILTFSVTDSLAARGVRLTNEYARQFTRYRRELDTAAIASARNAVERRIKALQAFGQQRSALYANLVVTEQRLSTLEALQTSRAVLVRPATGAAKQGPRVKRDAAFGLALGLLLGFGLAFARDALDTRVRTAELVEEVLGLSLLGRIPKPSRRLRKTNDLVLLADPRSVEAETYRKLRTSIEFVSIDREARTLMVTSAVKQEGKSTTIADLAIAFARAGRRVALVDLDLRRPMLHRFFDVGSTPGITDVAMRRVSLAEATRAIALTQASRPSAKSMNGGGPSPTHGVNGKSPVEGVLHFVPAGTLPPSPSEFLEDTRMAAALEQLESDFDLVLVDAPPLLAFGDAMSLSAHMDAMFTVVRMNVVQRPTLQELARQLQNCRATKLGFVLTGVSHGDGYRYGYEAYGYDVPATSERTAERT